MLTSTPPVTWQESESLAQSLKAAFKATRDFELGDREAAELATQLDSLGVKRLKVPALSTLQPLAFQ